MCLLRVENLSAGYNGSDVVKDISFTLGDSESMCIVGPNGCGKTTLLRAVARLIPSRGTIEIDGMPIQKMNRRSIGRKIAMMSQLSSMYFSYTVYETVMLGRYLHMSGGVFRSPSKADREAVEECLGDLDLLALKDKEITILSGGQLQRVFLARVLVQKPNIILLDEPTNHLDLKYQIELMDYLRDWSRKEGHGVIGVMHDMNLSMRLADRVMLMDGGRVAAYGGFNDALKGKRLQEVYGMDVAGYMKESLRKWEKLG